MHKYPCRCCLTYRAAACRRCAHLFCNLKGLGEVLIPLGLRGEAVVNHLSGTDADQLVLYRDSTRRRHQRAPSAVNNSRQGRHRRQNGRCSSPTIADRATEARSLQVQSCVCRRASCMPCHAGSLWADADLAGLFGRKVARSGFSSLCARQASRHPHVARRMTFICSFGRVPLGCPQLQVCVRFTATRQHPRLCCVALSRQLATQRQGL